MPEDRERRKERFSKKMMEILNAGAVNLALAIGYRTGLLDAMDGLDTPLSSAEIAAAAGLHERYAREWLGVMAAAGIVELTEGEGETERFLLPGAHGDLLTRRAGEANLGVYTQEIPLLTQCAMEAVVDGFHTGSGVGYERYPKFQAFMTQLADAKHRRMLISTFLPSVDGGRLVKQLQQGIRVCDVGCGEGVGLLLMAEAFPNSRFTGIDLFAEPVEEARRRARRMALHNVEILRQDASELDADEALRESFDYVTAFDAIHDQTRPRQALAGVWSILKPGGRFSMVDIAADSRTARNLDHPMGAFLYTVSLMHCLPVGLVEGGEGLGMMWGRQKATALLQEAGFYDVKVSEIPEDPFNLHFFCTRR